MTFASMKKQLSCQSLIGTLFALKALFMPERYLHLALLMPINGTTIAAVQSKLHAISGREWNMLRSNPHAN